MRGLNTSRRVFRYGVSLAEQGFASTLNLGTNLWLIRHLMPSDYGLFVLASNVALILCNVQGGMTISHLMALPAGPPTTPARDRPERMILAMTILLVAVSGLLSAIVLAIFDWRTAVVPLAFATYLPALMLYSYTRSLAFSRGLVAVGAAQSGAVLLIAVVLLGAAEIAGLPTQVDFALLILSLAYGGAAVVTLFRLCGGQIGRLRIGDLAHFGAYARESAWVLIGIGSVELLGRFNSVIVSAWFDTAAVGTLGAAQLLLRPIGMAVSAYGLIGRVEMVDRREAADWRGFVDTVLRCMAGSLAISLPWVAAVYLAWPLISSHLFAGKYAGDAWIVLLSGILTILGALQFMVSLGFQSLRRFRLLAYADMVAAAIAIATTMTLVMLHFGFAMSLVGMMAGQAVGVALLGFALARMLPARVGTGRTMMRWFLVTPFLSRTDQPWIHEHVSDAHHSFEIVTADYAHDRARKETSGKDWLDYMRQALRAWRAGGRSPIRPVGFITAFPPSAVCMGLLKRLTLSRAPVVAWAFNLSHAFTGPKRRLASFALSRIDVFVVFSRREIQTYAEMLKLPRHRFEFVPFTEEMVAREYDEDTEAPFILAMGTANRDYPTLLAAVSRSGIRTVIVAGARAVEGLAVPANVEVRSGLTLPQCHELCQRACVNVVPLDTLDTASGQVTLRYAMMFGRATIATRSIGTEDYIEDGVTGVLVPPRDPAALAAAIERLWHDPEGRAAMGEAAREWLYGNAGFEVGPARLREILERIRLDGRA